MRAERPALLAAAAVLLVAAWLPGRGTHAAFSATTANPGNSLASAPDWRPPIVARATVQKAEGGIPGHVRASGAYSVVANVVDDPSSNPPTGVAAVTANVGTVTAGATAVALGATASTVGGESYTHRSGSSTVAAARAPGTYGAGVTAVDAAAPANTSASLPFSVVVDNTVPAASNLVIANGGIAGRPDARDTVTFTWNDVVDPHSVQANWTGTATPVTVQISNVGGNTGDTLSIRNSGNTAALPLGTIALDIRGYVTANTTFGGPTNATRSTMTWNGGNSVTVTFGPADLAGTVNTTSTATSTYTWTPTTTVFDRAGNPSSTAPFTETGAADREF